MSPTERGDWSQVVDDDGAIIVCWLPWDDEVHESHKLVFENERDASIARDVLHALEAKPRHS